MKLRFKKKTTDKPKILLIADVPNWIFARHCKYIMKHLSDEFDFTLKFIHEKYKESDYDLIYPLEFNMVDSAKIKTPAKYVTGIRSHWLWQEMGLREFLDLATTKFQRVHAVSKRLYDEFEGFLPNFSYFPNGVNIAHFTPKTSTGQSGTGHIKVGFAGNRNTTAKGYAEFIEPLEKIEGVELVFCGYDSKNLGEEDMHTFYDSIDVYISAALSEGSNNSLLEAALMERAIVTTDNGTVPEYLRNEKNALIVPRELPYFIKAIVRLRDDPDLRVRLGEAARPAVEDKFDWVVVAEQYRTFFKQGLAGKENWKPEKTLLLEQLK